MKLRKVGISFIAVVILISMTLGLTGCELGEEGTDGVDDPELASLVLAETEVEMLPAFDIGYFEGRVVDENDIIEDFSSYKIQIYPAEDSETEEKLGETNLEQNGEYEVEFETYLPNELMEADYHYRILSEEAVELQGIVE